MTMQATDSATVYRHPAESEDQRSDEEREGGEEPRFWPLQDGRRRYIRPLVVDGSESEPDVFDVRDRIPLEFAGDDGQRAGKRAARIEQDLIGTFDFLMEAESEA